jgi:hypothetical protein
MSALVQTYLGFAFILILVFLVIMNGEQFKKVMHSLSAGNIGTIVALQGGNPGKFVN